nr:MAG TPA: hypothetical protein [Caudoviricetes sp.]
MNLCLVKDSCVFFLTLFFELLYNSWHWRC